MHGFATGGRYSLPGAVRHVLLWMRTLYLTYCGHPPTHCNDNAWKSQGKSQSPFGFVWKNKVIYTYLEGEYNTG